MSRRLGLKVEVSRVPERRSSNFETYAEGKRNEGSEVSLALQSAVWGKYLLLCTI